LEKRLYNGWRRGYIMVGEEVVDVARLLKDLVAKFFE
jgi:hypothetical protein